MNCKQGDIAQLRKSYTGCNAGKVVTCVRLHDSLTHDADGRPFGCGFEHPRWVVDPPLPNGLWGVIYTVADCNLRPLRDGEGEDEMLRLVGLPNVDAPQAA